MKRPKTLYLEALRVVYSIRQRLAREVDEEAIDGDFWREMWGEAAAELGAELCNLGEGFFEIQRGARRTRVRRGRAMIDDPVTLQLAGNKPVVHRLLTAAHLPVPEFVGFSLGELGAAQRFVREMDGPCVVKPARNTGGGRGVTTHVETPREIRRAALQASLFCRSLVIERQVPGDVYRLLYLDGQLLDAVRRRPPYVVGDGRSSVRRLIELENHRRLQRGMRGISIGVDCRAALDRVGSSLRSVPAPGRKLVITGISNAGSEIDSESVLDLVGKDLREEGARAAGVLGVAFAGVDVITRDPGVSLHENGGCINEVNTTPGFKWHYHVRDPERRVRVAIPLLERLLATDGAPGPEPRDATA
jgi:cyanophycin synthetase